MLILALLLLLTSCSSKHYIDVADRVLEKQSKKICEDEDLKLFGMGGAMLNGITRIACNFTAKREVDVQEARRLIVVCIERLRSVLNTNEHIKAHLIPYPFPSSQMDINISFIQKNEAFVNRGCAVVYQMKGILYYASYNISTQLLENFYEEPYDVALEIVMGGTSPDTICDQFNNEKELK